MRQISGIRYFLLVASLDLFIKENQTAIFKWVQHDIRFFGNCHFTGFEMIWINIKSKTVVMVCLFTVLGYSKNNNFDALSSDLFLCVSKVLLLRQWHLMLHLDFAFQTNLELTNQTDFFLYVLISLYSAVCNFIFIYSIKEVTLIQN